MYKRKKKFASILSLESRCDVLNIFLTDIISKTNMCTPSCMINKSTTYDLLKKKNEHANNKQIKYAHSNTYTK